jgi:hypothetical protein
MYVLVELMSVQIGMLCYIAIMLIWSIKLRFSEWAYHYIIDNLKNLCRFSLVITSVVIVQNGHRCCWKSEALRN